MAGRCCLPLRSVCWGLCHDHSRTESLLWGCRGAAAAQALSSMCILNPGNPPSPGPAPATRSHLPSSPCCSPAWHVTAGWVQSHGSSAVSAGGWHGSPMAAPHLLVPLPRGGWSSMLGGGLPNPPSQGWVQRQRGPSWVGNALLCPFLLPGTHCGDPGCAILAVPSRLPCCLRPSCPAPAWPRWPVPNMGLKAARGAPWDNA